MLAGFLFKMNGVTWPRAFLILGVLVSTSSSLALLVRFTVADEQTARREMEARLVGEFAHAAAGD
jgi:NNP family nitrate/nitrite transporter-like MFS transporter